MRSAAARKRLTGVLRDTSDDLLRYFLRRLDREDAADALADVMTTAWTRVGAMPDESEQARMWLFGIARNVLLHARRGNVRRSQLADRMRMTLSLRSAPPADEGSEIRDAIDRLDGDLGELIRLVHWDGFSITDAATLLEIPSSTARGRYQRAKEALREALAPPARVGTA
ncbi:RNA polymerase sigma factor [Microbacterium sp.]|uniref:RNA polymerase sigma factor n=1 Tax=Microbacterium sp. TaxID=51671 RepID=UPI0026077109|nr:RNA polymerase sigma factor [Microbacterium sp.]